jgi:hypothetical protein
VSPPRHRDPGLLHRCWRPPSAAPAPPPLTALRELVADPGLMSPVRFAHLRAQLELDKAAGPETASG